MNLEELYSIYSNHPEGQWIISSDDARDLSEFVNKFGIKKVLELGTGIGCSAAVMSNAKDDIRIVTVEQFDKCKDVAEEITPYDLKKRIHYFQEDAVVVEFPEMPHQKFSKFFELPEVDFDMLLIDGPGVWLDDDGKIVDLPNGDFIELLEVMRPKTFLYIDGRKILTLYINKYFSRFLEIFHIDENTAVYVRSKIPFKMEELNDIRLEKIEEAHGNLPLENYAN